MGTCVYHIAHQRLGGKLGNIGKNVEPSSSSPRPCMTPVSWR